MAPRFSTAHPGSAAAFVALMVVVSLLIATLHTYAHGDVHEAIGALNQQIEKAPDSAELYLRRGSLYRTDQDWAAAMADYDRAAVLDPKLHVVDLAKGDLLAAMGKLDEAEEKLSRYISKQPDDPRGWTARGKVRADQAKWESAAEDFGLSIQKSPVVDPQLVLDQVAALKAASRVTDAQAVLDEAIRKSGSLVALVQPAIDLNVEQGRWDAALAHVDRVLSAAPRKERWLARRAEILEKASRRDEALTAYQEALAEFQKMPAARRAVAAMAAFETKLRDSIARLKDGE